MISLFLVRDSNQATEGALDFLDNLGCVLDASVQLL